MSLSENLKTHFVLVDKQIYIDPKTLVQSLRVTFDIPIDINVNRIVDQEFKLDDWYRAVGIAVISQITNTDLEALQHQNDE